MTVIRARLPESLPDHLWLWAALGILLSGPCRLLMWCQGHVTARLDAYRRQASEQRRRNILMYQEMMRDCRKLEAAWAEEPWYDGRAAQVRFMRINPDMLDEIWGPPEAF